MATHALPARRTEPLVAIVHRPLTWLAERAAALTASRLAFHVAAGFGVGAAILLSAVSR